MSFIIGLGASSGGALGFTLGTGVTTVVTANVNTTQLTFVNVSSTNTAYVCQSLDQNGSALTAGANAGNLPILPLSYLQISGPGAQGQWNASASGAGTPFTVMSLQGQY